MITFSHVCAGYKKKEILHDVSFTVLPQTVTAIVGKNGSGKSTLAACILGLLPVFSGEILLNQKPLSVYSQQELAHMVSFMPQILPAPAVTVQELIGFGRAPFTGLSGRLSPADKDVVARAATRCGLHALLDRRVPTLSGGERQRAYLAMALAQEAPLMVFDEPSSSMDVGARSDFMQLLRTLAEEWGRTVVVITHELADAVSMADSLVVLDAGRVAYAGPTQEERHSGTLERVFGVTRHVFEENGEIFTVFRV